ncbi:MAG TPA: TonB-dependent receptor [Terriglobales bacterium]|nr:TonB-dependent receptor [Terriglobales bacterium]
MIKSIFLSLLLLLPIGVKADQTSESGAGEKIYQLEPVIVTATRYPEHLKNITSYSTQLFYSRLKKFNLLSLGEVLKNFSNGEMKSSGELGQVQTFSLRGSSSSQVLFLLEGRKLNYIANGIFNLSDLPLENLDKVEIVHGPLSSLYGANALGGVVNLIPSSPSAGQMKVSSSALFGDRDSRLYSLKLSSGIKKLGIESGLERKQTQGERENSEYSSLFFHSTLFYQMSSQADLKLYLLSQTDDMGLPGPVPDPLSIPKYGNLHVSSLFDKQKDKNFSSDLNFNFRSADSKEELSTRLFFDRRYMDYSTKYDFLGEVDEAYSYLTRSLGGFIQYSFSFQKENRLNLGGDFTSDLFEAEKNSYYVSSGTNSTSSWHPGSSIFGLWGNSSLNKGKFTFQAGARVDLPSNFEKSFSPNLGVIYHLNENLSLKFNYGRAYRAPTFNDLYWPDGGNEDLKPETGQSFETGLSYTTGKTTSQISVFSRRVKNLISWQPLGENGLWQPFNLDRFNSWGAEFQLGYALNEGIDFDLNYSFNKGEEIKKDLVYDDYLTGEKRFEEFKRKARFQPEHSVNLNFNLKVFSSLSTQFSFNYRSQRLNYYPDYSFYPEITYQTKKIKPSLNVDFNLNQKINFLTFSLKVNNLFNDKTPTQFGNSFSDLDYPNPGRKIYAGVRLEM